jgi:hypothetical protein
VAGGVPLPPLPISHLGLQEKITKLNSLYEDVLDSDEFDIVEELEKSSMSLEKIGRRTLLSKCP